MIDTIPSYATQPTRDKKKKATLIIAIVVLVVLFIGWFIFFRQTQEKEKSGVVVTEKKEPTPTEKPKIDKKSVKIQILNGTGTPGHAGTALEALKKAGYNSDNIKTGNAEEFTTTVSTVTARDNFGEIVSDVKKALEETFPDIIVESSPLDEESEFDIVVVTGGKKFETVTPTNSSTVTPTATITPSSSPTPTP